MRRLVSKNSKDGVPFRVVETFSGIGAQAMALRTSDEPEVRGGKRRRKIPYKVLATSDISRNANAAYNAINADTDWDPSRNLGDITNPNLRFPESDILTYSFPCQALSACGKREGMVEGSGTSSSLLWALEDHIRATRPEWLLMENVTQIHNKQNLPEFQRWIDTLSSMGYESKWADLKATDFGLPQTRTRTFMLSHLGATCPDLPRGGRLRRS